MLTPEGEAGGMVPRQESAFDRSPDRKVTISLSRRSQLPACCLASITFHRNDDTDLENRLEILDIDISSG